MRTRFALGGALLAVLFTIGYLAAPARADLPIEPNASEQFTFCNAIDVTASGGAAVSSAVAGKRVRVVAFTLASTSGQVVSFFDGSGGDTLATVYMAANTNLEVGSDILGEGFRTTAGNAVYASAAAGTLTGVVRLRYE